MDRRTTIKWMLAASATMPLLEQRGAAAPATSAAAGGHGYGTDPNLTRAYRPGDIWPLTLTSGERRTAAALCDAVIPADAHSPAASAVGVVDFLDEWLSAPYPRQQHDRLIVLKGLAWMDLESKRRFSKGFADLSELEQHVICDEICSEKKAKPALAEAARFFARYRDLTAGGFYSTPVGHKDLQYIGNVPLASFEGPPAELLARLGLVEEPAHTHKHAKDA